MINILAGMRRVACSENLSYRLLRVEVSSMSKRQQDGKTRKGYRQFGKGHKDPEYVPLKHPKPTRPKEPKE